MASELMIKEKISALYRNFYHTKDNKRRSGITVIPLLLLLSF